MALISQDRSPPILEIREIALPKSVSYHAESARDAGPSTRALMHRAARRHLGAPEAES